MATPSDDRWNSLFDSLRVALNIEHRDMNDLCSKLTVDPILEEDRKILLEYLALMCPIAIYLDALQGDQNCYLGLVLPTINKIRKALQSATVTLSHCFREGLLSHLNRR